MTQQPTPLASQYPQFYADWVQGGGIEHAFAAHLQGIGVLPADIDLLVANVESAWAELKNALPLSPKA